MLCWGELRTYHNARFATPPRESSKIWRVDTSFDTFRARKMGRIPPIAAAFCRVVVPSEIPAWFATLGPCIHPAITVADK